MGKIVAAMATMHAPQLFTRPPEEDPQQLDAGTAAMLRLGQTLDETKPDALIIFASDHMETFFLKSVPTFSIVAGDRAHAIFAGKTWSPAIHHRLAEGILDGLVRRDFDMAYSQDAELGHSFAAPFEWVLGGRDIPVVPIFVNTYLPPLPSARRCAALSHCRHRRIAAGARRPSRQWRHVALSWNIEILSSRFRIRPLVYRRTEKRAQQFLSEPHRRAIGRSRQHRDAAVGAGARGDRRTAHGALVLPGDSAPRPRRRAVSPRLDSRSAAREEIPIHDHPFAFYQHPPIESYRLNKLLYDSRWNRDLRLRMLRDITPVATEYGLGPNEITILRQVCTFPHNNTERPALDADPLVELGAHPVGALMAVHVLQAEQRRLQQQL